MSATLEVPVDSIEAAVLAAPCADRLELCDDLASEGWSPTRDVVRATRAATRCSIVAMIRPRVDGALHELVAEAFRATPHIVETSLNEIDGYAKAGADSVAIGLLDGDGMIDMDACTRLRDAALQHGMIVAFLRTFDLLTDRSRGMQDLTTLKMTRVVTAGVYGWNAAVATLSQRISTLQQDVATANHHASRLGVNPVQIIPGGGVRSSNARQWLQVSPHLHASCRTNGVFDRNEVASLRAVLRSDSAENPA